MILSVSRRTDIPAFYSEWFLQRIREGFLYVRNPMSEHQVSRIDLNPDVVDCIVFWTKNPAPMLGYLDELNRYDYYFQYTLNCYGREVEPHVPPLRERLQSFISLSERIGKERVIWRYDPILFSDSYTPAYHLEKFSVIAQTLCKYTQKCVFSFVDTYVSKNSKSLLQLKQRELPAEEMDYFLKNLAEIARENGLKLSACAENLDLEKYGIGHNSCIDRSLIEKIIGTPIDVRPDGQRPYCRCVKCDDIGAYDTCPHGCVYCYANYRSAVVADKRKQYDANAPMLCSKVNELTDRISVRTVKSYKKQSIL